MAFIAFFLFLILSIAAYICFSDYQVYREFAKIPPIDKWSAYSDSSLGLSFKYPPGWSVEKTSGFSGYPQDYFTLSIHPKNFFRPEILVQYDVNAGGMKNDNTTRSITVNNLKLYTNSGWSFYYLDGLVPIGFNVYNWYSTGDLHTKFLSEKEQEILNEILYSIQKIY